MKTLSILRALLPVLICMTFFTACKKEQAQQYTVTLSYPDGTTETRALVAGSMLMVRDGDNVSVAKITDGENGELVMDASRYAISSDSTGRVHNIRKADTSNNRIKLSGAGALGGVKVQLQSMAMIDIGNQPIGACKGICCEATCFSIFCCGDVHECKNTPCDCKGPSNCPGQTPGPQAAHFFELFKSGKESVTIGG